MVKIIRSSDPIKPFVIISFCELTYVINNNIKLIYIDNKLNLNHICESEILFLTIIIIIMQYHMIGDDVISYI